MKDQGTISLKRADTFSNFIMLQHSVAAETVASLIICCGEKNRQSSNVIKKKFHTPTRIKKKCIHQRLVDFAVSSWIWVHLRLHSDRIHCCSRFSRSFCFGCSGAGCKKKHSNLHQRSWSDSLQSLILFECNTFIVIVNWCYCVHKKWQYSMTSV